MISNISTSQLIQYAAYLILLAIAGVLEYFKLLPAGTVGGLFLLVVGHFFGNTPAVSALNQNTVATKENTVATATAASVVPTEVAASIGPSPIILATPAKS